MPAAVPPALRVLPQDDLPRDDPNNLHVVMHPRWKVGSPRWATQAKAMFLRFNQKSPTPLRPFVYTELPKYEPSFILPDDEEFTTTGPNAIENPSHEMLAAWASCFPEKAVTKARWNDMSEQIMEYVAGQMDGDGCITMCDDHPTSKPSHVNASLKLKVGKAENAYSILYLFKYLFGGDVYHHADQQGNRQASREWVISGWQAYEIVYQLQGFSKVKKNQYEVGASYLHGINVVSKSCPVASFEPESRRVDLFSSISSVESVVGNKRQGVHKVLAGIRRSTNGKDWERLEPLSKQNARDETDRVRQDLRDLKHDDHEPIEDGISHAYAAGFIDADGCLFLGGTGSKVYSVCQKYRAICDAFQEKFSGAVDVKEGKCFIWRTRAADRALLQQSVFPHLIEKYEQGQILIRSTAATRKDDKKLLRALKGNYLLLQDENGDDLPVNVDWLDAQLKEIDEDGDIDEEMDGGSDNSDIDNVEGEEEEEEDEGMDLDEEEEDDTTDEEQ